MSGVEWVLRALACLSLGVLVVVLSVLAAVVVALTLETTADIPGVFTAWPDRENGELALSFLPRPLGMLVAVLGVAALTLLVSAGIGRRGRR